MKERIGCDLLNQMSCFIKKHEKTNLTEDDIAEGRKLIDKFIDESCKCYSPISSKVKELKEKNNSELEYTLLEIKQLVESYENDLEAHKILYDLIKLLEKKI